MGAILGFSSLLKNIHLSYVFFVLFLGFHEFCFCSANAQVAIRYVDTMNGFLQYPIEKDIMFYKPVSCVESPLINVVLLFYPIL